MGCKAEDAVDGGVVFHFLHQQVIGFYRHTEYMVGCGGIQPIFPAVVIVHYYYTSYFIKLCRYFKPKLRYLVRGPLIFHAVGVFIPL